VVVAVIVLPLLSWVALTPTAVLAAVVCHALSLRLPSRNLIP
jgi:hypothetical protein